MKKVLGILLFSSSLFSMELAYKSHNPLNRFNRVTNAIVKNYKEKISSIVSTSSPAAEIPRVYIVGSSLRSSHTLSDAQLYHDKEGFVVLHNNQKRLIEPCFMDKTARSITGEGLKSFLKTGYFELKQANDGSFKLNAHHRLRGGGPLFGGFMYWLTKSFCYGSLAAVASTAVVTTGAGVVGLVAGSAVAGGAGTVTVLAIGANAVSGSVVTAAGATTLGTAIATTAGVGVGVGTTAAAVSGGAGMVLTSLGTGTAAAAAVTKAATVATGAALASGVSAGGIIVGIETLSVAIGTFFGMLPIP